MTLVTRLIGQLSRYKHEHMLLNNLKTPCVFKRFTHTADRCCVSRALSQMVIPEAQHTEILNYWLGPGWDEPSRRFCVGLDRMKHWFMGGESVDNVRRDTSLFFSNANLLCLHVCIMSYATLTRRLQNNYLAGDKKQIWQGSRGHCSRSPGQLATVSIFTSY